MMRDLTSTIDAGKITTLKKIIAKYRQPWVRCVERKLSRLAKKKKGKEAISAKHSKKEAKTLKEAQLKESALTSYVEIVGVKQGEQSETIRK